MKDSLVDLFCRLAAVASPPGSERGCADIVIEYVRELGLAIEEDDAGRMLGGDTGNLYCRLPPTRAGGVALFLCAHLDTVPMDGPIEPIEVDGYLVNAQPTILGADNKAAVAVMLDGVRTVVEERIPHAGLELVLTVREEQGLRGAKFFDRTRLQASTGYVYDHSGPIGGMVLAAPSRTVIDVEVVGHAAHAGINPWDGHNAIAAAAHALARVDQGAGVAGTTTNIGLISGGSSANVVAERCVLSLEVRSLDDARCRARVAEIVDLIAETVRGYGCTATSRITEAYYAYRIDPDALPVRIASSALHRCGFEPMVLETGGGADAHIFTAAGCTCLNLAHGVEYIHSREERVRVRDLHDMRDVTLALIGQAALTNPTPEC